MNVKLFHPIKQIYIKIRQYPKKYTIGGSIIVVFLLFTAAIFWPRTISFSYAGSSCIAQLILFPEMMKTSPSAAFTLTPEGGVKQFISTKVCAKPSSAPQEGRYDTRLSLLGIPIGTPYQIKVGSPPKASFTALDKPLPVSKPLIGTLSEADNTFTYVLSAGERKTVCKTQTTKIQCDVPSLNLAQGTMYATAISRHYQGGQVAEIEKKDIRTLTAVAVKDTSIKKDETIYTKPKSLQIAFDKPIESVEIKLQRADGDKKEQLLKAEKNNEGLTVSWEQDLDRAAPYQMVIDKVVARDGSTLVEPYILPFTVSGGPKVSSINIGKTGVAMGSTAIISFDQPLSEKQDIAKFVSLTGGATIVKKQGQQLYISLAGAPRCGDISINFTNDLASNYDVAGHSAWSYTGRMKCHTVSTIGTSSKGRAISAYHFGTGPASIVYTGAIHGNELSTRALMMRWIDELEANARAIPNDKTVIVVPVINPDGVASGTRTNGNNVDLNRNFGTSDWKTDITTVNNTPFLKGGGSSPMSEPETKAIASLVGRVNARLVLSYHSIGGVIAANQAGISSAYAQTYSRLSGYSNATGSGTTFEYAISGTADDYYAEKLGVPSILIELGSHSYHQFERNQKAMWAMLQ